MTMGNHFSGPSRRRDHEPAADARRIGQVVKEATAQKIDEFKLGVRVLGRRTRAGLDGAVRKAPWLSLMFAAALGVAAAVLVRRRWAAWTDSEE